MSRKFLDFNPTTGMLMTTAFEDGKNYIKYEQDQEPFFEDAAILRADEDRTRRGFKEGFMHGAYVSDLVIMDMLTRFGVNFYDKHQRQRVLQLIETEYPKCKTTTKKLWMPKKCRS